MKDFDVARTARREKEINFTVGGERFVRRRSVRPEAMEPWEDIEPGMPQHEALLRIDQTILNLTEDVNDGHARWRALREREDDAVTFGDLLAVVQWLVEEQSARPTAQPSPSYVAPTPTGTPLMAVSSLPDTPAAQAASTSGSS